jgi:hypothetical protein
VAFYRNDGYRLLNLVLNNKKLDFGHGHTIGWEKRSWGEEPQGIG